MWFESNCQSTSYSECYDIINNVQRTFGSLSEIFVYYYIDVVALKGLILAIPVTCIAMPKDRVIPSINHSICLAFRFAEQLLQGHPRAAEV